MRTTVDLPDELFRRAKATAAIRGIKLKDLIAALVEEGLAGEKAIPVVREGGRPLPDSIIRTTGVTIPAYSNAEIEAILIEEDARKLR